MQAEPNMQIQDKSQETHNSKQEKSGFEDSENEEQQQQHQQEQEQEQKRLNESKKKEHMKTDECESGNKEVENIEKKACDPKMEKVRENGGAGVLGPRDRLKKHRREVAGQVWIPDMWGQEAFLKDWVDCSAFDASLMPKGIMLARASLMEEGRRSNSNPLSLRLERSSC